MHKESVKEREGAVRCLRVSLRSRSACLLGFSRKSSSSGLYYLFTYDRRKMTSLDSVAAGNVYERGAIRDSLSEKNIAGVENGSLYI